MPDEGAEQVAASVIDNVIEPALSDLQRSVSGAATALSRRAGVSLVLGSALTSVGLLALAPLTVPGAIVGAGSLLASYGDFVKDRKEVGLSDMYFLWKLSETAARHRRD
jgi:hypothetical protein